MLPYLRLSKIIRKSEGASRHNINQHHKLVTGKTHHINHKTITLLGYDDGTCLSAQTSYTEMKNLKDGYISIKRKKGSLGKLTLITPPLQEAINQARALFPDAPVAATGEYLIHNSKGLKTSKNKFDSAWQRMMKKTFGMEIKVGNKWLQMTKESTITTLKPRAPLITQSNTAAT